jgi:hypothetical protein
MTRTVPPVAVLSGDLVGSTAAGAAGTGAAMALAGDWAGDVAGWMPGRAATRFTRFRGDGWQILLAAPALAPRAALTLAARLRAAGLPASRIAIGIGAADLPARGDLSAASGSAFAASGRALDALPRAGRLAIDGTAVTDADRALLRLAEEIAARWTRAQAEATADYLNPAAPTLDEIATRLGISAQAVHARLRGAGARALRDALRLWEADWKDRAP